ncbi:MAG TPA: PKD domain-containing protein, partial [Flavisolibacter sp.]|nr:PKD domain-containing protein [Flavisolibacter sp.]
TYVIRLTVFSPCDTLTFSRSIRVKSTPKALFTPTKTTGCSPMTVTFKNTSKGNNVTYFWDFGDGTTYASAIPDSVQHTFVSGVVDTFFVKLKAVNECGADSLVYAIVVAPNTIKLNLAVNGTDRFGCAPHTVSFINNSQGASVFRWAFGDGATTTTTKNLDTVRHTYLTPGTYTVTLQAINNCSDTTTTETITVYPKPRAQFTADKFTVCIGDSVRFTNLSDSATAYRWTFGDGRTSTLTAPNHTYTAAGSYVVTLVTFRNNPSGNVCTDSTKQTVTVASTQTGLFTVSDSVGSCAPFTVTLVNKNKPSVTATWDLGDGNTATGDSIVHTYQTAGTYLVKLTTRVPGGCTYITTKPITVNGPKGSLQYTGGYVCHPSAVQFQAVATGATTYEWNFGDGTVLTTTQQTVFHTYQNAGFYVPKVTLKNGTCGIVLSGIDTIKVDKVDGGFRWAKTEVCGSTTLSFTDTSRAFFGVQSIRWNFGDNTTGTGAAPSHTYTSTGRYVVQLIVQSRSGCTDTVSTPIDVLVKSIPVVAITAVDTACTRRTVAFNAVVQTADAINFVQWNVSNGANSTGAVFNHTFTQPGTYDVRLVVGTINGCYDTARHTIGINPSPVVTATPSLDLCRGNTVPLNVIGATTWQWLPLSGLSCYTCPSPIASPTITTPYVVQGKNSFGCADYDTVVITVIQPLQMNVSPDDSICIGQSSNLLASGASSYNWSPAVGLNNTTLSNPTATPTISTRYRVVGYDGYNCFTDTAFVTVAIGQYPTVNLGPDLVLPAGTLHTLTSVVSNGPIRNWNWTPSTNLSCATCPLPLAEIKKDITYRVNVTTAYGCSAADTINIKVSCSPDQVYVPNAFSPDRDKLNDVFMIRGKGIATVNFFRVFNRWGEMVFEATAFKPNDPRFGWNGNVKGVPAPPDVFVYTWEAVCENGPLFSGKGNVTVVK